MNAVTDILFRSQPTQHTNTARLIADSDCLRSEPDRTVVMSKFGEVMETFRGELLETVTTRSLTADSFGPDSYPFLVLMEAAGRPSWPLVEAA